MPDEYLEQGALIGSPSSGSATSGSRGPAVGATGLIVRSQGTEGLEILADLAGTRDTVGG